MDEGFTVPANLDQRTVSLRERVERSRGPAPLYRFGLLRASLPVLASLVDEYASEKFPRLELAHGESVKPGLAFAREATDSRARSVPLGDVDAVGAALAEEDDGHDGAV
jgi:hypothetical protein